MGRVSVWHLYNQVDHLMNSVMIETIEWGEKSDKSTS